MPHIKLTSKNLENLQVLLKYLLDSEKNSYEEYIDNNFSELLDKNCDNHDFFLEKNFYEKQEIEHIYAIARRVKDAIDSNF